MTTTAVRAAVDQLTTQIVEQDTITMRSAGLVYQAPYMSDIVPTAIYTDGSTIPA
jgi:hypothetical protein